jgi:hypothetical protein
VLHENWVITWDKAQQLAIELTDIHAGDRFVNRGQDLIRESQSQLSSLDQSSSSSPSSEANNTKAPDHDIFDEDGEPRRSGHVRCPTRDVASQMSQDAKPAKAKEKKKQAKEEREGEGNEHFTAERRVQSRVSIALYSAATRSQFAGRPFSLSGCDDGPQTACSGVRGLSLLMTLQQLVLRMHVQGAWGKGNGVVASESSSAVL